MIGKSPHALLFALLATSLLLLSPRPASPEEEGEPGPGSAVQAEQAPLPYRLGPPGSGVPTRVVSLSPALTDTVTALGAGNLLVGVTRFCEHPTRPEIARVGGFVDPNIEAVLALRPELVLAEPSPGNREAVLRLATLGVPLRVVPHGGVAEVRRAIIALGEDLDRRERSKELLARLDADIEVVRRAAAAREPLRVALIYGREPLVLAGPGSFGHELLTLAGGENVAADAKVPYPTYPLELLVARRPDVVIETTMTGGAAPPLPHLSSARHLVIPGDALLRPGPGLGEAARRLFVALHPDEASAFASP